MGDLTGWGIGLSVLSGCIWLGLLTLRGQFWRAWPRLEPDSALLPGDLSWPAVWVVVPARNEASLLPATLGSLLQQDYPGPFRICLVDDQSSDGTREVAWQVATDLGQSDALKVMTTSPLPSGWSGKLWAIHQGIEAVLAETPSEQPIYFY